ncbi:MAG TPA: branched-chain amino acid ABC transporter permease [Thermoanaerobaculia bacterium]|nr:branched-chain amino acid ABC transporter permease [Thermoanaerobaculia bacterium]
MSRFRCGDFKTSYAADMAIFDSGAGRWCVGLSLLGLLTVPLYASSYWMDVANRIGIAVIAALGLNILTGFTGQISLGNAAFMAVGAYSTAYSSSHLGLPLLASIPLAGLFAAVAGMIFGVPSLRLKGLYLAMATLAAHFIMEFVVSHWNAVTGGVSGVSVPAASVFGHALDSDTKLFYLILPLACSLVLFAKNLFRTKVGKAFVAIRDHDISAEVMGVNLFKYKLISFGVSSFYVGVAGSLLAYQARYISPESFPITLAIDTLAMIIIGGMGSILGAILGAIFITGLPELLRLGASRLSDVFPALVGLFASLKLGVFGLAIVLFLIFEPDGLAARWRKIKTYWRLYPFSY